MPNFVSCLMNASGYERQLLTAHQVFVLSPWRCLEGGKSSPIPQSGKLKWIHPGKLGAATSSSFNFPFYSLELGLALELLLERFAADPGLDLPTALSKFSLYIYTAFSAPATLLGFLIFFFNRKTHLPTNHRVMIFKGGFTCPTFILKLDKSYFSSVQTRVEF